MKVAVSAVNGSLDALIDPRFGRCQHFIIVDSKMSFEALPNTSQTYPSGVGIQAAQTTANKGAKLVITGSVSPNAYQVLSSVGIEIITDVYGSVREAIRRFKSGQLREITTAPTVAMGSGMGRSYGIGMSRGRGAGRGKGFKCWHTTRLYALPPTSKPPTQPISTEISKKQETRMLESQMETMHQQLNPNKRKVEELKIACGYNIRY